jgi:excisionase family DNA binding protein
LKEDPDVLTATEAAALLRVSTKTVLALAREGALPGEKVGRAWRFLRPELFGYLRGAGRSASSDRTKPRL